MKIEFTKTPELYCDMDGVLTNFSLSFEKLSGGIPPEVFERTRGVDAFWELIDVEGLAWWENMPWMPDGKELWSYIKHKNPEILSAPTKRLIQSREGKELWVKRELPKIKLNLTKAKYKCHFANPNAIIIDDMARNINQWREAGGIGILHISAQDTIRQLKAMGL